MAATARPEFRYGRDHRTAIKSNKEKSTQMRNPSCWGKIRTNSEGILVAHPLLDHCLDVAMVFRTLLDTLMGRRAGFDVLSEKGKDRLAVIAFLHDIGKANWGFQAKADPRAHDVAGHVIEAIALLQSEAARVRWPSEFRDLLQAACEWFVNGEEGLAQMLVAAISHHGRPVSWEYDYGAAGGDRLARYWQPSPGSDPMQSVAELASAAHAVFSRAFAPGGPAIDATAALQRRFSGLLMLADWIASDTQFFPYRAAADEDRKALAAVKAREAIEAIGLVSPNHALHRPRGFVDTFGFPPTALQRAFAQDLPIDEASRLVLIESETGSGKTEAALAWFLRLHAQGCVDGLYFALPTRVAARELYGRVLEAIRQAYPDPDECPRPVLLGVPGYVRVDGDPILPDPEGALWEDEMLARRRERMWSAERPKRFLAAPVVVGTIDQALLSVLSVKHALLRSVCLDRHLVVVDEVHASDTYMRELLQALLRGHQARGGWALLLSATLGESARKTFFTDHGTSRPMPIAEAVQRPYPSVTTCAQEAPVAAIPRSKSVRLEWLDNLDDKPLIPALTEAISRGARVLVVCNTVGRANSLLREVEADGRIPRTALFSLDGVVCPHHGRFARDDRERLDARVTERWGKGTPPGPVLLIGTQTLEQSLDIDADWLVTDLAPMDVLLQRIGRLHRHERPARPAAFGAPRVLLRFPPEPHLLRYVQHDGELRGPAGLGGVYADGRVLQCTLDTLRTSDEFALPRDNRALVEAATHPEAWAALGRDWKAHHDFMEGKFLGEVRAAITAIMDESTPFGDWHWPHDGARVASRLGAVTGELTLSQPMRSPFGSLIERVPVPHHLLPGEIEQWPEQVTATQQEDGFRFQIAGSHFRYTRFGLEVDDA